MAMLPMLDEEKYRVVRDRTSAGASTYSAMLNDIYTDFQRLNPNQQRKSILVYKDATILRPVSLGRFTTMALGSAVVAIHDMDLVNGTYRYGTVSANTVSITDKSSDNAPSGEKISLAIFE